MSLPSFFIDNPEIRAFFSNPSSLAEPVRASIPARLAELRERAVGSADFRDDHLVIAESLLDLLGTDRIANANDIFNDTLYLDLLFANLVRDYLFRYEEERRTGVGGLFTYRHLYYLLRVLSLWRVHPDMGRIRTTVESRFRFPRLGNVDAASPDVYLFFTDMFRDRRVRGDDWEIYRERIERGIDATSRLPPRPLETVAESVRSLSLLEWVGYEMGSPIRAISRALGYNSIGGRYISPERRAAIFTDSRMIQICFMRILISYIFFYESCPMKS